jgi:hypothetical protein
MEKSPNIPTINVVNRKDSKRLKTGIWPDCKNMRVRTMPLLTTARSAAKNSIFLHFMRCVRREIK